MRSNDTKATDSVARAGARSACRDIQHCAARRAAPLPGGGRRAGEDASRYRARSRTRRARGPRANSLRRLGTARKVY